MIEPIRFVLLHWPLVPLLRRIALPVSLVDRIADDLFDEIKDAIFAGEHEHVRWIERRYRRIPGVRLAVYAINECAAVMSTEEMLERIERGPI